jgi:hypothetical protein
MFYWEKCTSFQSEARASVFSSIEAILDIEFPRMAKKFMLTYLTGQYFEGGSSYIDKYLRPTPCYGIDVNCLGSDNFFNWLYSPEEIAFHHQSGKHARTVFKEQGLLQIGCLHTGMLFIDCKTEHIFSARYSEDLVFNLVASNIYEFVAQFRFQAKDKLGSLEKYGSSRYWTDPSVEYSLNEELILEMASSQEGTKVLLLESALEPILRLNKAGPFSIFLLPSIVDFLLTVPNDVEVGQEWLLKIQGEELRHKLMLEMIFNNLLEDPYCYPEVIDGIRSSIELYSTGLFLYTVSDTNINILGYIKRAELIRV